MNTLRNISSVYLIGIGGIGMSALARYFNSHGKFVAGYDRSPTRLTQELTDEGISIHFEDDISFLPPQILDGEKQSKLIIYTPAIPPYHKELNFFKTNGYAIKKRSEILGLITSEHYTIAIAGTHGKTTTASMVAHILTSSGVKCIAFLGGIAINYQSNFIDNCKGEKPDVILVEADEYDRSFLQLAPDLAVITSTDADHLDVYDTHDQLINAYSAFAQKVKDTGTLVIRNGVAVEKEYVNKITYAANEDSDYTAYNIMTSGSGFVFDLIGEGTRIEKINLSLPGNHNVENALAASIIALKTGVTPENLKAAIGTFSGVRRRFEFVFQNKECAYIDDYAHHPAELRASLEAVKRLYPGISITGIFQPHLFSRTRDFADEFAASLSLIDDLVLLEIYPAREIPIEGVTSQIILDKVTSSSKRICTPEEALIYVSQKKPGVLLTLGAGDIDKMVGPISDLLTKRYSSNH